MVAGQIEDKETKSILREINQRFIPAKVILFRETSEKDDTLLKLVPFLANQKAIGGKTTFYACRNQTCEKPRTELLEIIEFLDKERK